MRANILGGEGQYKVTIDIKWDVKCKHYVKQFVFNISTSFSAYLFQIVILDSNDLTPDDLISKEAAFQMIEKAFLEIYFPKESLSNEKNIYLVKTFITILKDNNDLLYSMELYSKLWDQMQTKDIDHLPLW